MALSASDVPAWFVQLFAFLFGAAIGSFLNVAIYRWPRDMSVVSPPSHCPGCGAPVRALHNIPLLGYLFLRGRTACCDTRLSPRYPLVELLTAVLSVAVAQMHIVAAPPNALLFTGVLRTIVDILFVSGLLVATFVDLERMEIPDEVSLPGAALGLATASLRDPHRVADFALGAGGGYLIVQLVFVWGYERLTGRRGMGEGDAKLLLMIGAFLGFQGALFAIVIGALQGVLVAIYGLITGTPLGPDLDALEQQERAEARARGETWPDRLEAEEAAAQARGEATGEPTGEPQATYFGHIKLPFGPFLALGALEFLFFGDRLFETWLGLTG